MSPDSSNFTPTVPAKKNHKFVMPGITAEAQDFTAELLERNHEKFNIFFNDRGFHNHFVHHVLTAYSLGANTEQLQRIFDDHSSYQRQIKPVKHQLDRSNYQDHLGDLDAYSDYLAFFKAEIAAHGMVETVRRFIFSGDMLARFLGGVYHPLIHMGYAFEFNLPDICAEALALTACTEDNFKLLIPDLAPLQENVSVIDSASSADKLTSQLVHSLGLSSDASDRTRVNKEQQNTALALLEDIRNDQNLKGVVNYTDSNRFNTLRDDTEAMKRLRIYVEKWQVQDDPKDIQAKTKDLYEAAMILYGGAGVRGNNKIKMDFFLLHAVTGIHSLHSMLSDLTANEAAALLQAHFAITVFYYVTSGSPNLTDISKLLNYKSSKVAEWPQNPWTKIIDLALVSEMHLIKVVRALALGYILYASGTPMGPAWTNTAIASLDTEGHWDRSGPGFEETWAE